MAKTVRLRIRDLKNVSDPFHIKNFHKGGWKVRTSAGWIRMVPENTVIRNPEHDPANPTDPKKPYYTTIVGE